MSKKSKAASKEERLKKKRARKAAMKAQYAAYALAGDNSKRKRARKKRRVVSGISHPGGKKCGNAGCDACHPWRLRVILREAMEARKARQKLDAKIRANA